MEVTILVVPERPHTAALRERLALALQGRDEVTVTWREVTDPAQAERLGMHGSPTVLVDGADPFARPGQEASLSCSVGPPPSVERLREAVAAPRPTTAREP
ncbi:thioredoxin family protein [Streptomyces broussonetiae]|uniref:Thioredoxin family protein n=1 Tax=Streptomyces broussonetiae TaxID=2686304 RepID=A0A6I6NKE9_9ACTN|nr:thioredoxin family protein [Streptomyces broussonetiae]QHA08347.1 thioredoxin family protein [Streptomyces broussonetiae]